MFPRHATDVISLVFGTLFAGLTVVWLLVVGDVLELDEARVAWPVILVIAGAVGLVAALRPQKVDPGKPAPPDQDNG